MNSWFEYAPVRPPARQADIDVDVRTLVATVVADDDGDPVLVLEDGSATVAIEFGIGGAWEASIQAAERLSVVAQEYANALREVRTKRRK